MQFGVLAYVPPPNVCNSESFLANLMDFPTKNRLILYSDYSYPGMIEIPAVHPVGPNRWSLSNLVFLHGLRLAIGNGLTHFLYLESDCRIGQEGWDQIVLDEFKSLPNCDQLVAAGSLAVYNPFNSGGEAALRFSELIAQFNTRRNFPVPGYLPVRAYGNKEQRDGSGSCVFVNGALGIYSTSHLKSLFGKVEIVTTAAKIFAWDMEIGKRMWPIHAHRAYDFFGVLTKIYSGYGDIVTTEKQRQQLLDSKSVVAIHQIKSAWRPANPKSQAIQIEPQKQQAPKPKVCPPYTPEPFILVLPFCAKDSALMLENVKWMGELGGTKDQDALLAVDKDVPMEQRNEILSVSKKIFRDVKQFVYPTPKITKWPYGPNSAFQTVAWHIYRQIKRPWFWMEADAVPLKPDWIRVLQAEYMKACRPLMGPLVKDFHHCNGVCVYPANFAKLSTKAMRATDKAWDFEMKDETFHMTHDAGHLIQHVWGMKDGLPHPYLGDAPIFDQKEKLIWLFPSAVVFHRCKDGSLIKLLRNQRNENRNTDSQLQQGRSLAGVVR